MRVCVVGGGLAGSLLAWRLAQLAGLEVDLVLGRDQASDATGASGGAVRAYETLAAQRELAVASLIELLASPVLREWADYRQSSSVYLRETSADLPAEVAEIERALPGSAEILDAETFAGTAGGQGWAGLTAGSVVLERQAGYLSPGRLRDAVLADLASRPRSTVRPVALASITVTAAGLLRCSVAGAARDYDVAVLAVGSWTPQALRANGLPADSYRTKSIQYTSYAIGDWHPPMFVDELTGLYGKPTADGGLLLGVPTDEWDVHPGRPPVTPGWQDQAARLAAGRFPRLRLGTVRTRMSAADCYCDPPVLMLRAILDEDPRLLTFTGGSGGAVKTALAASRRAADLLARAAATTP